MSQTIDFNLNLDPGGFVSGAGQATQASEQMTRAISAATLAAGPMQRALGAATPSRAFLLGLTGVTAAAAATEQRLSTLYAQNTVTYRSNLEASRGWQQLGRGIKTSLSDFTPAAENSGKAIKDIQQGLRDAGKSIKANFVDAISPGTMDPGRRSIERLTTGMKDLASSYPIGSSTAKDLVIGIQQSGIAARGTEGQVIKLAEATARLSGATGEGPMQLAHGMITLGKTMGGAGLQPRQYEAFSDSLTTLSAKSGSSATNILHFSKSIAPMAQNLGIGQSAVMGMATAFTELGENGFAPASAFNKMLLDINDAVNNGSPQLETYAKILGTTREEVESLAKSDASELVVRTFESLGRMQPGQGQRALESLGIEGVRAIRPIQQIAQSGSMRRYRDESVASYGSGSTRTAAEAAFGGLADSLEKLRTESTRLAEAFGTPLLGAVQKATDVLSKVTGGTARAVESGPAQTFLSTAAYAAVAAAAGRFVLGPLLTGAAIRQVLTSGPIRNAMAATARGRYIDPDAIRQQARDTVADRARAAAAAGTPMTGRDIAAARREERQRLRAEAFDRARGSAYARLPFIGAAREMGMQERGERLGRSNQMNRFNTGVARFFERFGRGMGTPAPAGPTFGIPGMNPLRAASRFGMIGLGFAARQAEEQFRVARMPTEQREQFMQARGRIYEQAGNAYRANMALRDQGRLTGGFTGDYGRAQREVIRNFTQQLGGATSGVRLFGATVSGVARAAAAGVGFGAATVGGGALRAGRGIASALMTPVGGAAGLAGMAAFGGLQMLQSTRQRQEGQVDEAKQTVTSMDALRAAMGKATESTATFATRANEAANKLAVATDGMGEALEFTAAEAAASRNLENPSRTYSGTNEQIAGQVRTQITAGGGASPDEMARIALEVGKSTGGDRERTQQILNLVGSPSAVEALGQGGLSGQDITAAVQGIVAVAAPGGIAYGQGDRDSYGAHKPILPVDPMSAKGRELSNTTVQDIRTGAAVGTENLENGSDVANQREFEGINQAVQAAFESGDAYTAMALQTAYQAQGGLTNRKISREDIEEAGSYTAALANVDRGFGQRYRAYEGRLAEAGGYFAPEVNQSWTAERLDAAGLRVGGAAVSSFFETTGPRAGNAVNQAVAAYQDKPASPQAAQAALDALANAAKEAGASGNETAIMFRALATTVGAADSALKRLAERGEANAIATAQFEANGQGPYQGLFDAIERSTATAAMTDIRTEEDLDRQIAARQEAAQQEGQLYDVLDGLLRQQMEYQVSRTRAEADYARTVGYAEEDYARSREYAEADYTRQREYTVTDYETQREYAGQDYRLQQEYAATDYRQSVEYAQVDMGRQRQYSQDDYNKQVQRANDDFRRGEERAQDDFQRAREHAQDDFQRQQLRSERDFLIQSRQAEDDYLRQRERAFRDFNKQLTRIIQDAAKTMYNPYERIQTQATWDARSLLSNLEEQSQAMRNQLANLDTARGAGLSDSAIRLLGLDKTENAQQLARLIDEIKNDPSVIDAINRETGNREGLAGQLYQQGDDYKRMREDFDQSMRDMEEDYETARQRAIEGFQRARADALEEFGISMERQAEEFALAAARSRDDFLRNQARAEEDHREALRRNEEAFTTQLERMLKAFEMSSERAQKAYETGQERTSKAHQLGLERMAVAQTTSMTRMEEAQTRSMDRMAQQQSQTMQRMAEDLARSNMQFTGSLTERANLLQQAIAGQTVTWANHTKSGMDSLIKGIESAAPALRRAAGNLQMQVNVSVQGQAQSHYVPGSAGRNGVYGPAIPPGVGPVYGPAVPRQPGARTPTGGGLTTAPVNRREVDAWLNPPAFSPGTFRGFATGGLLFNRQVIEVAEQGPELVLPLDHRGATYLATLMSRVSVGGTRQVIDERAQREAIQRASREFRDAMRQTQRDHRVTAPGFTDDEVRIMPVGDAVPVKLPDDQVTAPGFADEYRRGVDRVVDEIRRGNEGQRELIGVITTPTPGGGTHIRRSLPRLDRGDVTAPGFTDNDVSIMPIGGRTPVRRGEAMRTRTALTAAPVTYRSETHTADYSTRITGPIQVVSQDPDDMAKKLAAKRARDNMVSRRPR